MAHLAGLRLASLACMSPKTFSKLMIGALLAGAVLEHAQVASACSPAFCPAPVRLPPNPWLPGNMVYFKLLEEDPGQLALRTAEGEPIAASIRMIGSDRVFVPDEPILGSTQLVLEHTWSCDGVEQNRSFEFLADLPGSIELRPATLVIEERGTRLDVEGRVWGSFARVKHYPGDITGAARPLMDHAFTIDGLEFWATDGVVEVMVNCDVELTEPATTTCGNVTAVAPGVHTVEAQTTIVGAAVQPAPVRLEVEVRCPEPEASDPEVDATGDNGSTDGEANAPIDDLDVDDDRVVPDDIEPDQTMLPVAGASSSSAGGCALGPRPASGAALGAIWALAGLLMLRARRKRRC